MEIQRVGVVGAGTMGNGIAHVFARSRIQRGSVRRGAALSGARAGNDRKESGAGSREGKNYIAEDRAAALGADLTVTDSRETWRSAIS